MPRAITALGHARKLPDETQRRRVLTDLGATLLVEAAAGTGKTSLIAGRVAILLRLARCSLVSCKGFHRAHQFCNPSPPCNGLCRVAAMFERILPDRRPSRDI